MTTPLRRRLATALFAAWYAVLSTGGLVAACPMHATAAGFVAMAQGGAMHHTTAHRGGAHVAGHEHMQDDATPSDDPSAPHSCSCIGDCQSCAAPRALPVPVEIALGGELRVIAVRHADPVSHDAPARSAHALPFATAPPAAVMA